MARRLLLLNGLAVLGVAFHHASGYGFRAMFFWTDRYLPVEVPNYDQAGSFFFYVIVLMQQIDAFTLPAFLFVSGFFIAFATGGGQSPLKWEAVTARVKNLLVPFIIWTILFFLILVRRLPANLDEMLDRYYYVILLMQFYLLSPFIVPLAKSRWKLLIGIVGVIEVVRYGVRYLDVLGADIPGLNLMITMTPKWLIPTLFFWFTFGVIAGCHRQPLAQWLGRMKWWLLATMIGLVGLMMLEYVVITLLTAQPWLGPYFGGMSRVVYPLIFILSFLAFDKLTLPFSKNLSQLGTKSLGIYLAHGPVMYVAAVVMYRQLPWVLEHQILYQGVLIVVGLGIPLVLMAAISNSRARGAYRYIFG